MTAADIIEALKCSELRNQAQKSIFCNTYGPWELKLTIFLVIWIRQLPTPPLPTPYAGICWCTPLVLDCSIGGALRVSSRTSSDHLSVVADLVPRCQVSGNQKMVRHLHVSFFVLTIRFLKVSSQIIVEFAPL